MDIKQQYQKSQQMPEKSGMPAYVQSGTTTAGGIYEYSSSKWNTYSVISLGVAILGFLGSLCAGSNSIFMAPVLIIAAILAWMSLGQIKTKKQRGKELVIATFVLIAVGTVMILTTTSFSALMAPKEAPVAQPKSDFSIY